MSERTGWIILSSIILIGGMTLFASYFIMLPIILSLLYIGGKK